MGRLVLWRLDLFDSLRSLRVTAVGRIIRITRLPLRVTVVGRPLLKNGSWLSATDKQKNKKKKKNLDSILSRFFKYFLFYFI